MKRKSSLLPFGGSWTTGSWQLMVAVVLTLAGVALLFMGFLFPPAGEIHSSILVAFGEVATFAGALFGVDYRYRQRDNI